MLFSLPFVRLFASVTLGHIGIGKNKINRPNLSKSSLQELSFPDAFVVSLLGLRRVNCVALMVSNQCVIKSHVVLLLVLQLQERLVYPSLPTPVAYPLPAHQTRVKMTHLKIGTRTLEWLVFQHCVMFPYLRCPKSNRCFMSHRSPSRLNTPQPA